MPGKKIVEAGSRVIGDAGQHAECRIFTLLRQLADLGRTAQGDPFATFDFQENVVLVVVMRASELIEVKRLVRAGSVLQVGAGASGNITFGPGFASWQAVSLPRRLLGRPLPRRIIFPWN